MPRSTFGSCLAQRLEVLAVRVPAADGERDAADAGFDQPAGGQELLDALVALAGLRVFLAAGRGRCGRTPAAIMSKARSVKASMPVMVPLASISRRTSSNAVEQVLAVVEALGRDAVGEPQVGDARAARRERPMRDAEDSPVRCRGSCRAG